MSRRARDPELNDLAHELEAITFPATHEFIMDRAAVDLRKVCLMPNNKTYAIKMFVGGFNRTLGYCSDHIKAARFADMCMWRLWKYRIRGACPPTDSDLNFGIASVKEDSAHADDAIFLLDRIESFLKSNNKLEYNDLPEVAATKDVLRRKRDERRTVRNDVLVLHAEVMSAVSTILKALEVINNRLGRIESRQTINDVTAVTDFIVNIPHPNGKEVLESVTIQIPVTERGTLTPEALDLIAQTKRKHLDIFENQPNPKSQVT